MFQQAQFPLATRCEGGHSRLPLAVHAIAESAGVEPLTVYCLSLDGGTRRTDSCVQLDCCVDDQLMAVHSV